MESRKLDRIQWTAGCVSNVRGKYVRAKYSRIEISVTLLHNAYALVYNTAERIGEQKKAAFNSSLTGNTIKNNLQVKSRQLPRPEQKAFSGLLVDINELHLELQRNDQRAITLIVSGGRKSWRPR